MVLHKHISAILKASTKVDTTVKNVYTVQLTWKLETVKNTSIFVKTASELPYCTIFYIFYLSWHSYKFICKSLSFIHNSSYWWVNDILTWQSSPPSRCEFFGEKNCDWWTSISKLSMWVKFSTVVVWSVLHAMNNMRAESNNKYTHNRIFWKTTGFYCFPYAINIIIMIIILLLQPNKVGSQLFTRGRHQKLLCTT